MGNEKYALHSQSINGFGFGLLKIQTVKRFQTVNNLWDLFGHFLSDLLSCTFVQFDDDDTAWY